MGNIDWLPIVDLPETLRDGRHVLLWDEFGEPRVGRWFDDVGLDGDAYGWADANEMGARISPLHFAEITPP